jgi:hypothetical protein
MQRSFPFATERRMHAEALRSLAETSADVPAFRMLSAAYLAGLRGSKLPNHVLMYLHGVADTHASYLAASNKTA